MHLLFPVFEVLCGALLAADLLSGAVLAAGCYVVHFLQLNDQEEQLVGFCTCCTHLHVKTIHLVYHCWTIEQENCVMMWLVTLDEKMTLIIVVTLVLNVAAFLVLHQALISGVMVLVAFEVSPFLVLHQAPIHKVLGIWGVTFSSSASGTDLWGETQGAGGIWGVTFSSSASGTDLWGESQGAGGMRCHLF